MVLAPTSEQLQRVYYELARIGARAVGAKQPWPYKPADEYELLVLAAELSRYDPRLFDIVVELLFRKWATLNPLALRNSLRQTACPQALLCMFNFIVNGTPDEELATYYDYLAAGFHPVPPQLYFKLLYAPGSRTMQRAAEEPLDEFVEWGFLARERPIIYAGPQRVLLGHWGVKARVNTALRLARRRQRFKLGDFLSELEYSISRQQALSDLKSIPHLKSTGQGRGSEWTLKHTVISSAGARPRT